MLTRADITLDKSAWPAWLVTAESAIDAALGSPWNLADESHRDVPQDLSGVPIDQRRQFRSLLDAYEVIGGWCVELIDTDNDMWVTRFSPVKGA